MTNQLIALLDGREVGTINYKNSRLSFVYNDEWRADPNAYPLSLSMPLASAEHGHARIAAFLWGLLPDNDRVLENWGRRFQVSPKNVFRLIAHVGEDCAGAVQFVRPERLEALQSDMVAKEVKWLTEDEVAERLRALRADHSAWRSAQDTGQFSLAGAQSKTALLFERKRWGVPSGRVPTTHILKPPTGEWDGHAENEHFSLRLARAAGLIVPNSSMQHFGDEIAIVVERYDRVRSGGRWARIQQSGGASSMGSAIFLLVRPSIRPRMRLPPPGISAVVFPTYGHVRAVALRSFTISGELKGRSVRLAVSQHGHPQCANATELSVNISPTYCCA